MTSSTGRAASNDGAAAAKAAFKRAIRAKEDWRTKVLDNAIAGKYLFEALKQDSGSALTQALAREALTELRAEAAAIADEDAGSVGPGTTATTAPEQSTEEDRSDDLEEEILDILACLYERPNDVLEPALVDIYPQELWYDENAPLNLTCFHCKLNIRFGQRVAVCPHRDIYKAICPVSRKRFGCTVCCENCLPEASLVHKEGHPEAGDLVFVRVPPLDVALKMRRRIARRFAGPLEPFGAHKVLAADMIVPNRLRDRLITYLDAIASRPDKDFHPGSGGKVLDLIHPSLYPFVRGESFVPLNKFIPDMPQAFPEGFPDILRDASNFHGTSKYQWLPAEVDVDDEGHVTFASYINNLERNAETEPLYGVIADILSFCVPMFEQVLSPWVPCIKAERLDFEASDEQPGDDEEAQQRAEELDWHPMQQMSDDDRAKQSTTLRNRRLQVIVKAANYVLKPGQSYSGSWHVEGMFHEQIVASAIYYYDSSECIADRGLSFRRSRKDSHDRLGHNSDTSFMAHDIFTDWLRTQPEHTSTRGPDGKEGDVFMPIFFGDSLGDFVAGDVEEQVVDYGTVPTPPGRIIVFPNNLQHRVAGIRFKGHANDAGDGQEEKDGASGDTPAQRKILCFFLVNPSVRIVSTADVSPQQQHIILPVVQRILQKASVRAEQLDSGVAASSRTELPVEVIDHILSYANLGMTHERALAHRRVLMAERKNFVKEVNSEFENYSLCEH